jgi:AcrR family transcriptional regulator
LTFINWLERKVLMADPQDRSSKSGKAHQGSDSREALIRAAQRVFAEKGYEGATVKDLADEASVNISLVSYHFGGKENLYRACMEGFGLERVESTERILKPASSPEDFKLRLRLFGEEFIDIHTKETDVCKMVHRGMETLDPVTLELFHNIFNRIFFAFHNFFTAAQKAGFVRSDLDGELLAGMAFGALMHFIKSDPMRRHLCKRTIDDPSYRELAVDTWITQFTEGIFKSQKA